MLPLYNSKNYRTRSCSWSLEFPIPLLPLPHELKSAENERRYTSFIPSQTHNDIIFPVMIPCNDSWKLYNGHQLQPHHDPQTHESLSPLPIPSSIFKNIPRKMGARPRLSRNNTFNSCPDIDFDEYDMFDTPQRSKSTAYREVRGTNPYYDNPPTQRDSPPQRRSPSDGRSSEPFEEEELVPDTAKVMRTLNYIRTDLEYLRAVDIISEEQMEIIMEQLPQSLPVLYSQVCCPVQSLITSTFFPVIGWTNDWCKGLKIETTSTKTQEEEEWQQRSFW